MTSNILMLNDSKTKAVLVANPQNILIPAFTVIIVDHLLASQSVRNLGITLDSSLSVSQHVSAVCRSANLELCCIGSVYHLVIVDATKTLVCAFVLSKLDYCNSSPCGCPQHFIDRFQKI